MPRWSRREWSTLDDPELLKRVLSNLLGNALNYTPKDGKIEINASASKHEVRVSVEDTGPGIPLEHRQSVFEKFRQIDDRHKYGSSGLGLAFCKLAIERHGGTMGVDERPGGGSLFWFTLPVQNA